VLCRGQNNKICTKLMLFVPLCYVTPMIYPVSYVQNSLIYLVLDMTVVLVFYTVRMFHFQFFFFLSFFSPISIQLPLISLYESCTCVIVVLILIVYLLQGDGLWRHIYLYLYYDHCTHLRVFFCSLYPCLLILS
jgi:hypothetical protein